MNVKTVAKWGVVGAFLVVSSAASLLWAVGVPKPPAIRTEQVGRVGWAPIVQNLIWFNRFRSKRFAARLPDGSGFLVMSSRRLLDNRLHVLTRPGGALTLVPELPRNAGPFHQGPGDTYLIASWDEDGDEQYRLYRWDADGKLPRPITPPGERSLFGASEPGGSRIAYTSNRRNGRDFDIYIVDPLDVGTDHIVVELDGAWSVVDWSARADQLLLTHATANTRNQLYTLSLTDRSIIPLTQPGAHYKEAQWSHDGTSIYYASDRDTEFTQLRRLNLEDGTESLLSGHIPWDVTAIQESDDGERLLVTINEGGLDRHYLTDREGAEFERIDPTPPGLVSATLHPNKPELLIDHTDWRGIGRAYVYDLETGALELWAGEEPGDNGVPAVELVHYPTFDEVEGRTRVIPAFVYPGVGPGPHPVVISVHGGPEAQARPSTAWGASQKRGVTVITPNVRGSTGYGRTFEGLDNGTLREDAVRDIGALLEWIKVQPELDEERVAIVGGSYGGYMVLASLVHFGPQIRCGIDIVGISNFVTFLENTADYRRDLRRAEYGDERIPEMKEFLHSISPLTHADRITSELMVVQGAKDPRVPVTEALQLVEEVGANGQDVAYVEAADEGHGFKKPWNVVYSFAAEQEMLGACLRLD